MSEIWRSFGKARLSALRNEQCGWLMWLAEEGDAGFSSRGDCSAEGETEFLLSNGQRDVYPTAWVLPLETVQRAIAHFEQSGERAPFVDWHDDGAI
ncbi:MAG: hypothetical protein J0I12_16345 [Candidatus Eremiobacteraeota bacterium]|nr:hypothetical protein [Candidatus Eremiobacteraeota bacterium]